MATHHREPMDNRMALVTEKHHDMAKGELNLRATHYATEMQQRQDAEERTNPSISHAENHNIAHCMTSFDDIKKEHLYLVTRTGVLEQGLNLYQREREWGFSVRHGDLRGLPKAKGNREQIDDISQDMYQQRAQLDQALKISMGHQQRPPNGPGFFDIGNPGELASPNARAATSQAQTQYPLSEWPNHNDPGSEQIEGCAAAVAAPGLSGTRRASFQPRTPLQPSTGEDQWTLPMTKLETYEEKIHGQESSAQPHLRHQ